MSRLCSGVVCWNAERAALWEVGYCICFVMFEVSMENQEEDEY